MVELKGADAGSLPALAQLLQKWADWVEHYCSDKQNPDAPYWYNEQTNTSTIVNTVAQLDGCALMEMTEEGRPNSKKKIDLWFMLPGSKTEYVVEAKRPAWSWYSDVAEWLDVARGSLDGACKQIKSYDFVEPCTRLAMCFVVPMVREAHDVREYVHSLIAQFQGWSGCDARAWYFNQELDRFKLKEGKHCNVYPGVMLLTKEAR